MRFTRKKILLISADKAPQGLLTRMGFQVVAVSDMDNALVHLQHVSPDMLVLDTEVPVNDLAKIQQKDDIPIIMMGDPEKECALGYMEMGRFLETPIRVRALIEMLNNILFAPIGITRKYLRVAYHGEVSVEHSTIVENLRSSTLSEGGMFIRRKEPLPVGSEATINITFPSGVALSLEGMVIYISMGHSEGSPPGMAMEFNALSDDLKKKLRDEIKKLLYN
jgi:CheY-like chemotaxis protein